MAARTRGSKVMKHDAVSAAPAPLGLRVTRLVVGDEELAVLSFPQLPPAIAALGALSPGEREVAELVLAGLTNAEIARLRGRSLGTVCKQLDAVYGKLGVRGRRELAALGARRSPT
jgi:DNA-binding CsgD family transcriptional regulator